MPATFVVEDGTGKSDANSYVSIADADQYDLDHNADAVWGAPLSDALKQKALRLATQYLDAVYGDRWKGYSANTDQALDWPRADVLDEDEQFYLESDEIPQALKDACVECAILSANGTTLLPNQTNAGTIKRIKQKLDVMEKEVEYVGGSSPYTYFSLIDSLIGSLTSGSAINSEVERS